jgi:hypothetical protein
MVDHCILPSRVCEYSLLRRQLLELGGCLRRRRNAPDLSRSGRRLLAGIPDLHHSRSAQEVNAVFRVANGEIHKSIVGTWIAVDVGAAAPPNYTIITALDHEMVRQIILKP